MRRLPPSGPAVDRSKTVSATFRISGSLQDGACLSDLPVFDYEGYAPMGMLRDTAHGNNPLRLGGQTYRKGLITHPAEFSDGNRACAEFALAGPLSAARRFTATIGVEDQAPKDKPNHGTCAFAVDIRCAGKWQRVFESAVFKPSTPPGQVDVDVSSADRLRLIATDGGDGIAWDHAVWANPLLH